MIDQTDIYKQGILIVDDEKSIRLLLELELQDSGFKKIYMASNGIECINLLNDYKEEITIILMDIKMPELDGIGTVQHLMNHYDGIVGIIFHTAYSEYKDETQKLGNEHALNLDWMVKSSNMNNLIDSVKRNLLKVLGKRKLFLTSQRESRIFENIELIGSKLHEIENISNKLNHIENTINGIENKMPNFWTDVGKQILITILLALFVLAFFLAGVPDIIKNIIK
ncbi:MAG: response regulator [Thermodesulfobacteriota bacterium]|nr:response regulator [Thermodesulfobacteriota bacterium]